MRVGIIGSGNIGGTLTRRLSQLGHEVLVANTRGPASLADQAAETGATAATPEDANAGAELIVLAVPLHAVPGLPDLGATLVVDANNYYPGRDGQIAAIDGGTASSRWVAEQIGGGARVVKAFNTIQSRHLLE
jgi:predicted dinucleotide-binding enzyme